MIDKNNELLSFLLFEQVPRGDLFFSIPTSFPKQKKVCSDVPSGLSLPALFFYCSPVELGARGNFSSKGWQDDNRKHFLFSWFEANTSIMGQVLGTAWACCMPQFVFQGAGRALRLLFRKQGSCSVQEWKIPAIVLMELSGDSGCKK